MSFYRVAPGLETVQERLLIPHFRQIADEMGLPYRAMPFTQDLRQMFRKNEYTAIDNAFRTHLTGDLYHEYSLG